jgi:hypothetical protein
MKDFIWSIERKDTVVYIRINTNLDSCRPIFPFSWNCKDQEYAELLKNHLLDMKDLWHKEIAQNPIIYLESEELSELKKWFNKNWDAKNHCHKK